VALLGSRRRGGERREGALDSAEFTVYRRLVETSRFGAVLNEAPDSEAPLVELPTSIRRRIVPAGVFEARRHPECASRAAPRRSRSSRKVISERSVQTGLRTTLLTQAARLDTSPPSASTRSRATSLRDERRGTTTIRRGPLFAERS